MAVLTTIGLEFLLMHSHVVEQPHYANHFGQPPRLGRATPPEVFEPPDPPPPIRHFTSQNQPAPVESTHSYVDSQDTARDSETPEEPGEVDPTWLIPDLRLPSELEHGSAREPPVQLLTTEGGQVTRYEEGRGGEGAYGDMRIAILVPYSGPGLPVWFDAFTDLAAMNKDLVDWIIFCEEVCIRE